MRTTVDIPDPMYKVLKMVAVEKGVSVKSLVLEGTSMLLLQQTQQVAPRLKEPLIKGEPGTLNITHEMIHDLLDFA